MIFFSIVIPLYNKASYIGPTIESILSQSFQNFELIVVNDGSTDGSDIVVSKIDDSRLRLINKSNGGVSSARNAGIENANGDWIVPFDADDIMLPNALLNLSKMIEKFPDELYFSGRTQWEGEKSRVVSGKIKRTNCPYLLIWTKAIDPAPRCVVFHKSLFCQYGKYDERMSFYEDWELSLRMAECGVVVFSDFYLARYTQTDGGMGSSTHLLEKEMAYYIPTMQTHSFWHKALLYENLQLAKLWWQGHPVETSYYDEVERKCFDWRYRLLHWIRQKMTRCGVI